MPQGDETNNGDSEAIRCLKKILTEPIQITQLNINRSPDVMTAIQQEYLRNTDILLYQEPVFSRSNQPQRLFLTPKILGFTKILPVLSDLLRTPPANRFPGVMAYARERKRYDHRTKIRHVRRSRHGGHRNPTATTSADTRCEHIQPASWERRGAL